MKIHKGDNVKVIYGKDKGKSGLVKSVFEKDMKVIVSGANLVKKHVKKGARAKEGGILSLEKPLAASSVMVICDKCAKPARVGYSIIGKKKYRVCKKCGEVVG
ncbi:50S ribosomal protein L24 [candidate division WWE3 bacterium]|nr:50S ribosomal protein L24 [candidate division WWE3 bacterium]